MNTRLRRASKRVRAPTREDEAVSRTVLAAQPARARVAGEAAAPPGPAVRENGRPLVVDRVAGAGRPGRAGRPHRVAGPVDRALPSARLRLETAEDVAA